MEIFLDPSIWAAFLTLTALEIVLGIDNIIFISILTSRLPEHQRARGRNIGLAAAMCTRILLLFSLAWMMSLTEDLFSVLGKDISARDLILLLGRRLPDGQGHTGSPQLPGGGRAGQAGRGAAELRRGDGADSPSSTSSSPWTPSSLRWIGAARRNHGRRHRHRRRHHDVASGPISDFVESHPTVKMLALSFLILIGLTLVGEAWTSTPPRATSTSPWPSPLAWTLLNLRMRKVKGKTLMLRKAQLGDLMQ